MAAALLDRQSLMELMGGYRAACIFGAAAELDLWSTVGRDRSRPRRSPPLPRRLAGDDHAARCPGGPGRS